MKKPAILPRQRTFNRLLAPVLGAQPAADAVSAAGDRYPSLLAACPPSPDRPRMERTVLPGLALYQALQAQGLEKEQAQRLLEPVLLEACFGFLRRGLLLFGRLPLDPFPILRPALRMMARPADGSMGIVIEDSPRRLVVHTRHCTILEALTALGAPELTTIFCASDDWLASALPRIRWLRTSTLGLGGAVCNFHWERA